MGMLSYGEGTYFAPQKEDCWYIIVPCYYVVEDYGLVSNFENSARNLNTVFHHIYGVMETSRRMFNFRVRLMKCRTTEACKVGAEPDLT